VIENVNAPDLKTRYFRGSGAQRPVTPVFWFAHAVVAGGM
jgi:O-methyltransferase involved in polyketide biosynthesis